MVDKVTRVSSSAPSHRTRVDTSLSLAEPEAALVARRQSASNAANEKRKRNKNVPRKQVSLVECDREDVSDPEVDSEDPLSACTAGENAQHLSGESERIGSGNLAEDVPFGKHVGYL